MAYYPPQQAPAPYGSYPQAPGRWSTGLCECCDDVGNCCMTCWCPCITFGRNAEILDRGTTSCGPSGAVYGLLCSLTGCQFIYSCMYRTKLRTQYNLPSDPCADCCVHLCCQPCALCQEFRELRNRGYDVKLGWHGNMERMAAMGTAVPPQVHGSMMR